MNILDIAIKNRLFSVCIEVHAEWMCAEQRGFDTVRAADKIS